MQPKVIFLDWDGTLSNSKFWENCTAPSLPPQVISRITNFLFSESPDLIVDWMKGFIPSSRIVAIVAGRFKVDARELQKELERSCRDMQFINPGIPDRIRKIRQRGTRVVIATDNMDTFENWTVPSLELDRIFDSILSSPTRGALKAEVQCDHSPFFDLYLSQQGVDRTESVLVDDNISNMAVESIGMQFAHVTADSPLEIMLDSFIAE